MASRNQGGSSEPPYPSTHSGPVLVVGSAECAPDDVARARERFPDAPAIAVNGAARLLPAFALFTQHPRNMEAWVAQRAALGGTFTTHSAGSAHMATKLGVVPRMPWIDYWWQGVASGGTSAWGARRMARFMGFDLVILCGVPLQVGRYFYGRASKSNLSPPTMRHYREQIMMDTAMHSGVRAMSGWTREQFGEP